MHFPVFLYPETKIVVFWDVVECPLPDDLQPSLVSGNIELALQRQGYLPCNVSIRVYGKKNYEFKDEFLLANIMFLPAGHHFLSLFSTPFFLS